MTPRRFALPRPVQKLTVSLAVLAWIALLNGAFAIYQINQLNEQSGDILDQTMASIAVAGRLSTDLEGMRAAEASGILLTSAQDRSRWLNRLDDMDARIVAGLRQYESLDSSTEQKRVFVDFLTYWYSYSNSLKDIPNHPARSTAEATEAFNQNALAYRRAAQALERLSFLAQEEGRAVRRHTADGFDAAVLAVLISTGLEMLGVVFVLLLLTRTPAKD